jgi:hypothetical protein
MFTSPPRLSTFALAFQCCAKPPLLARHVWSIRTKLQIEGRTRDLAMFNLAIDSKLRGCDLVGMKVEDVGSCGRGGRIQTSDAWQSLAAPSADNRVS